MKRQAGLGRASLRQSRRQTTPSYSKNYYATLKVRAVIYVQVVVWSPPNFFQGPANYFVHVFFENWRGEHSHNYTFSIMFESVFQAGTC